jgi:hypothetical protein
MLLRQSNQAMIELEFHISPAPTSSRPHTCRHLRGDLQQLSSPRQVRGESLRTVHGFTGIGDHAITPAAQLVAEYAQPARPAGPHRPFSHDAAGSPIGIQDRRLLHHEPALRHPHLKRRVIQVADGTPGQPSSQPLVKPSVPTDGVPPGAQRQPTQVDARPCDIAGARCSATTPCSLRIVHPPTLPWICASAAPTPQHAAASRPPMCPNRTSPSRRSAEIPKSDRRTHRSNSHRDESESR